MLRAASRLRLAPVAVLLATTAACSHEAWITPVPAPRTARDPSCAVAIEAKPEPGTRALAVVRCADALVVVGKSCWSLVREKACETGGDVVFGAHYESGDLVATIGTVATVH